MEKTVVLIKPDGVKRGLVGEILNRFEKAGLKIVAMKMVWVDKTLVGKHYTDSKKYLASVGKKTLKNYQEYGWDAKEKLGTADPVEIGRLVRRWNMEFLSSGPVAALLLEGYRAVGVVRKIVGSTFPYDALPGTIRGDYSFESSLQANAEARSVRNLIHASGSSEEAEFERQLWFREKEIYSYKRVDEDF